MLTGWITAFFPYLKDHETGNASVPMCELFAYRGDLDSMLYPGEKPKRGRATGPTIQLLPGGLSKAPFRWDYLDRSFDMEFLGGFVGVAQDQETLTLRPEIGWAVREAPTNGLSRKPSPCPGEIIERKQLRIGDLFRSQDEIPLLLRNRYGAPPSALSGCGRSSVDLWLLKCGGTNPFG